MEDIPQGVWKLALAVAAAIWGGSFVVIKDTLDAVTPAWLMCTRFFLAAILIGVLSWKSLRVHLGEDARGYLWRGVLLGLASGTAYVVQNMGLDSISPGRNAFLTATYCVMVPFLEWMFLRRRPGGMSLVAALMCVLGVGLLSLGDGLELTFSVGDALTLLGALLFAVHIVLVAEFSKTHDVMTLTVVQTAASAVVALAFALALEPVPAASTFASPSVIAALAYMVILSSGFCSVMQNLGQAHVPPAQASLILSLESVFAVIASVLFYHEVVTPRLAAGFACIFVAVVVSEVGPAVMGRLRVGKGAKGDAS